MSPEEFKIQDTDFEEALKKRCEKEGIQLNKINIRHPYITRYVLDSEVYDLYNDGNQAYYQFVGIIPEG
jgi:hypothetical protein